MSISLQKGQRISLAKNESTLSRVTFGVGWDAARGSAGGLAGFFRGGAPASIDLDASCVLFKDQQVVDTVWFQQLRSKDGSIIHTGDNLTGDGDGDDEQIIVDLTKIPAEITSIFFTVNSFSGQSFDKVENAYCRILDAQTDEELAKLDLCCQRDAKAIIMTQLYRHQDGWKLRAIDEPTTGKTWKQLVPAILKLM